MTLKLWNRKNFLRQLKQTPHTNADWPRSEYEIRIQYINHAMSEFGRRSLIASCLGLDGLPFSTGLIKCGERSWKKISWTIGAVRTIFEGLHLQNPVSNRIGFLLPLYREIKLKTMGAMPREGSLKYLPRPRFVRFFFTTFSLSNKYVLIASCFRMNS